MSLTSLTALASFATANNYNRAATKTPVHELEIEAAREIVRVKDGNKKPKEDGSQALVLMLGKKTLKLDVIAKDATRVNATAEQVQEFTALLENGVKEGQFDVAIKEAQEELRKAKEEREAKPKAPAVDTSAEAVEAVEEVRVEDAPEGVDLDALD